MHMGTAHIFAIIGGIMGLILLGLLAALFFISRRSQRVMESLLTIMTQPDRARVTDATNVLQTLLAGEMAKLQAGFGDMRDTLNAQIAAAAQLKDELGVQNESLVTLANDAAQRLAQMSQRLDNTVMGLRNVIDSDGWADVGASTDRFVNTVDNMLAKIDATAQSCDERTTNIQNQMTQWVSGSTELTQTLSDAFERNDSQMKNIVNDTDELRNALDNLTQTTANGFANVKSAAAEYDDVMTRNNQQLDNHLAKMDNFSKLSKKQLTAQMNTLTNTANVVGGQVRLAESSVETQIRKLTDAVEALMSSATATEGAVRGISTELATLTGRFNGEIKEFATGVVTELKTVSGVANVTLENTKTAANAFSDSVRAMATGVRETLMEMNTAHTQLSGQSANLIKMSAETTAQLQPLSELIEKYYAALPDLSRGSVETSDRLAKIVSDMTGQIADMKNAVSETTTTVADSAARLEDLAGQSRQQMIDLMSDYAKAVNTMQTLNKQMMVARAAAPMEAIGTAPSASYARVSSADFLKQTERMFDKLHEQTLDLTRAAGADIPDVVWKKYHAGDKTIFSKWLAKMMGAADKKQIRDLLKSDAVFRSQATQFVRGFDKIMAGARETDNADQVAATLLKTDLGHIYVAIKAHV